MADNSFFTKKHVVIAILLSLKLGLFITGYSLGVHNAEKIRKEVNYAIYGTVPIEKTFYGDIYGVHIIREINKDGKREVYLCNYDENIKKPIDKFMVSGTDNDLIQSLEYRIKNSPNFYSDKIVSLCERIIDYEISNKKLGKEYKKRLSKDLYNLGSYVKHNNRKVHIKNKYFRNK